MRKPSFAVFIFSLGFLCISLNAQSWFGLTRLTWNAGDSRTPSISSDSGTRIHVAWTDNTPGNYEIFYKRSNDNGSTWSGITRLTWTFGSSQVPSIDTDSGSGVYVVWHDFTNAGAEIFFKRSTNSGTNWLAPKRLTWNSGPSQNPCVALGTGLGVHVVWDDNTPGNMEIFYKRGTNNGSTWLTPKRLSWNAGNSRFPSVAASPGNIIHVVWQDDNPGNYEIFYKQSTDGGGTWSGLKRMTWTTGVSMAPTITTDAGTGVHLVWQDFKSGGGEIFYKKSTNLGITWLSTKRVTWNISSSMFPSISVDSLNGIHVVWKDDGPGNYEIFYKGSTNSGVTWSGLSRLSWNTGHSGYPKINVDLNDNNRLHVIWEDETHGNWEIFYKREIK